MLLRPEHINDTEQIEALLDTCFTPRRTLLSAYRLRVPHRQITALSRVVVDNGIIIGAIRYWPIRIIAALDDPPIPAVLLGPLAVHPMCQGEGIGSALISDTMQHVHAVTLTNRVILVGDVLYYARFGFTILHSVKMPPPTNPQRVLSKGDWGGIAGQAVAMAD